MEHRDRLKNRCGFGSSIISCDISCALLLRKTSQLSHGERDITKNSNGHNSLRFYRFVFD